MLDIDAERAPRPPPILAAGARSEGLAWLAGDAAMAERWGAKEPRGTGDEKATAMAGSARERRTRRIGGGL
jgi:hypothetical protein